MEHLDIIKKAYGDKWELVKDQVNEYGYLPCYPDYDFTQLEPPKYWEDLGYKTSEVFEFFDDWNGLLWCPISLKGLDFNNDWYKTIEGPLINDDSDEYLYILGNKTGDDFIMLEKIYNRNEAYKIKQEGKCTHYKIVENNQPFY